MICPFCIVTMALWADGSAECDYCGYLVRDIGLIGCIGCREYIDPVIWPYCDNCRPPPAKPLRPIITVRLDGVS